MKRHSSPFRGRALRAAALSLGVLTGCSGTHGPDGADRAPSASATASADRHEAPSDDFTFRLPIASYAYTDAQDAEIAAAEDVLTERCMKELGISWTAVEAPETPRASDRRYGLSNADEAARYGYHLPPEKPFNPNAGLSATTLTALYGRSVDGAAKADPALDIPARGCRGEAAESLDAGHRYQAGAEAAGEIARNSYQRSTEDPRVREVVRKWSDCMAGRGYSYADPLAALGDERFLDKPVSKSEVATARADMRCKTDVGLLQTWFSAEQAIQQKMIAGRSAELEKLRKAHAAKTSEARTITGRD
ncbi:hypothetical protein AB0M42_09200 [Streptomyces sp. NPDC051784]|uniref:hypothetical protein n=1 Tax=Streptomyces sp. NPDC051784 TaxID=3155805 RepID=UPI0034167EF4